MRIILAIAFCVAAAWGMVAFFVSDKPAAVPAAVMQNVDPQRLEQDMVKAADWLETSPCDSKYRESLRRSIIAYANVARTGKLSVDKAAKDVIRGAVIAGGVRSEEIGVNPKSERTVVQAGGSQITIIHHSPYVCRPDGDAGDNARQSQARPDLPENTGR